MAGGPKYRLNEGVASADTCTTSIQLYHPGATRIPQLFRSLLPGTRRAARRDRGGDTGGSFNLAAGFAARGLLSSMTIMQLVVNVYTPELHS